MSMLRLAVTLFLISMSVNGFAVFVEEMGINDGLGIDVSDCGGGLNEEKKDRAGDIRPGAGESGDASSFWFDAGQALLDLITIINPAADQARCAGVPDAVVGFIFTVLTFIPLLGFVGYLRGTEL